MHKRPFAGFRLKCPSTASGRSQCSSCCPRTMLHGRRRSESAPMDGMEDIEDNRHSFHPKGRTGYRSLVKKPAFAMFCFVVLLLLITVTLRSSRRSKTISAENAQVDANLYSTSFVSARNGEGNYLIGENEVGHLDDDTWDAYIDFQGRDANHVRNVSVGEGVPDIVDDYRRLDVSNEWNFHKMVPDSFLALPMLERSALDNLPWVDVDLPHSWNRYDTMRGLWEVQEEGHRICTYERGTALYRADLGDEVDSLLEGNDNRRVWLRVERASIHSVVFVSQDGHNELANLFEHKGGYLPFAVEISPDVYSSARGKLIRNGHISKSKLAQQQQDGGTLDNVPVEALNVDQYGALMKDTDEDQFDVVVAVSNSYNKDIIPSDKNDFFLYGGLSGSVHLETTGPARMESLFTSHEKLTVSTLGILKLHGRIDLRVTDISQRPQCKVLFDLKAPGEQRVGTVQADISLDTGEFHVNMDLRNVVGQDLVQLWSPSSPALYDLKAVVEVNKRVSHVVRRRIGFRFFEFVKHGPFKLNGEPLKLWGTNRHDDWAGEASAVSTERIRSELMDMKSVGFNFVRLAHYPQREIVLDTCDEIGLIVWEELPWSRGGIGGSEFRENTRQQLTEMLREHATHPSIVFWGLGNELDVTQAKLLDHNSTVEDAVEFLRELRDLTRAIDPERLTIMRRCLPCAEVSDVYSPSLWSGWYTPGYKNYASLLMMALKKHPRMLHVEYGGASHYGRYCDQSRVLTYWNRAESEGSELTWRHAAGNFGDWSESYILDLFQWTLSVMAQSSLAGSIQWSYKDFGTPLRPENPIPCVNQKGIVDRAGRPKNAYFLYKAYLSKDPVCHIESTEYNKRYIDHNGMARVRVFSNCRAVELRVNSAAFGAVQTRQLNQFLPYTYTWDVSTVHMGENDVTALCACDTDANMLKSTVQIAYSKLPRYVSNLTDLSLETTIDQFASNSGPLRLESSHAVAHLPNGATVTKVSVVLVDNSGTPVLLCNDRGHRVLFAMQSGAPVAASNATEARELEHVLWAYQGVMGGSQVVELANGAAYIYVVSFARTECTVEVHSLHASASVQRTAVTFTPAFDPKRNVWNPSQ